MQQHYYLLLNTVKNNLILRSNNVLVKPKNIFAVLANKRKAGSHRKSNKALRREVKIKDRGGMMKMDII